MADVSVPTFEISGLPAEQRPYVKQIIVDSVNDGPAMFEIILVNKTREDNRNSIYTHDQGKFNFQSTFKEGQEITVQLGYVEGTRPEKLIVGEITGTEAGYGANGPAEFVVRGYDKLHRLTRGRHQRTFQNVKDSDLASQIAGEVGLDVDAEDSKFLHDHVFQNNLTNLQFLYTRARRIGYEVSMEDSTLIFKKPRTNESPVATIKWSDDVRKAKFRLSTAAQVNEVQVRGWDPKTKKEIIGKSKQGDEYSQMGGDRTGAQIASGKYGVSNAKVVVCNVPLSSVEEANNVAKGYFNTLALGLLEGEADVEGNPAIKAGKLVEFQDFGTRYDGIYYITQCRHVNRAEVGERGGYRTRISFKRAGAKNIS